MPTHLSAALALLISTPIAADFAVAQQTVEYPALGLRFDVPTGWQGQEGDGLYLLQHASGGIVALLPHQATSRAELEAGAREGLNLDEGTSLQPSGAVEAFGRDGVRLDMAGMVEWSPSEAHAIGLLSPHGRGVVVVAVAPYGGLGAVHREIAETVARSVVFAAPEVPPVVEQWAAELRGVRLAHYDTRTGFDSGSSSKQTLTLCDGVFAYASSYSGFGNTRNETGQITSGMSAAGSGGDTGTWTVVADAVGQPVLRLVYEDGTVEEYALAYEDGKTYLDDTRVLRTEADCY